jgi:PAS domain-containing protein
MDESRLTEAQGGAAVARVVAVAIDAAGSDRDLLDETLNALPVPVYLTDAEGWVTFSNPACIDFAGRVPVAGEDRWCVTWKLYAQDGAPLPHEECPMAVAIRERRALRGHVAIAERPDGRRSFFTPYPTPLYDEGGTFTGAVNILIALDGSQQAGQLLAQAERCRRLSALTSDRHTADTLASLALEYEEKAGAFKRLH